MVYLKDTGGCQRGKMGYEHDMDDWHDELHRRRLNKPYIRFHHKSLIDCRNVGIYKIVFEYVCWILAGKPKKQDIY